MDIYRRIALLRTEDEADDLIDELIDRFGDLPSGVSALINVALLRGEAGKAGISDISQKSGKLIFALRRCGRGRRKHALADIGAAARDDAVFVGQLDIAVSDAGKNSHREHERDRAEKSYDLLHAPPPF